MLLSLKVGLKRSTLDIIDPTISEGDTIHVDYIILKSGMEEVKL